MVAHEKRNPAQLFCAVPTQNDLALSSLRFPAQPTQKLEYPRNEIMTLLQKRLIILLVVIIVAAVLGRLVVRAFLNLLVGGTLFGGNFL